MLDKYPSEFFSRFFGVVLITYFVDDLLVKADDPLLVRVSCARLECPKQCHSNGVSGVRSLDFVSIHNVQDLVIAYSFVERTGQHRAQKCKDNHYPNNNLHYKQSEDSDK